MKVNNHLTPWHDGDDYRPLVLLTIGLLVVVLHLCQFPPTTERASSGKTLPVAFVWLDNQPAGGGLYRLRAEKNHGPTKIAAPLPNRLRPLFFQPVAVNQADQELLSMLPGIGPVLAQRIVSRRRTTGNFNSPRDLLAVPGIGAGKLEKIRNLLAFD